jgi:small subunit ribosomal protein S1
MTSEHQRQDFAPPPTVDEGYWTSLLNDGEFASVPPDLAESSQTPEFNLMNHTYQMQKPTVETDWDRIQAVEANDEILELPVVGYNRGGLLVEWRSLRGFVPSSQLLDSYQGGRRRSLPMMIGEVLQLRVIELNPEKNRLILSERAAQARPGERASILNHLSPGDTVTGIVTNLCDFGAFVDLGGLEGLIHISELSWGRVAHPDQVLQPGQQVTAHVLDINRDNTRIALSIKRLRPDPWKTVEQRYTVGQIVQGIITNVVDFGAFACIEEGLEGLIHVSELAEGQFLHPRNVVSEGQTVHARILSISGSSRRLGLSLRLQP